MNRIALFCALSIAFLAPLGHANVELTTTVQRVVAAIGDDGQVVRRLEDVASVTADDVLHYTIRYTNNGVDVVEEGSIVITCPIPQDTVYLAGTAKGAGATVTYSVDDGESFAPISELSEPSENGDGSAGSAPTTIRWVIKPELAPGQAGEVSFDVRMRI